MDKAKNKAIKSLIRSKNIINKQFIDMHRIRQAMRYGVKIGFKGFQNQKNPDDIEIRQDELIM